MKGFPYVQEYRDNRGKMRRYFRRGSVRIALKGEPGSAGFQEAYAAALAGARADGSPSSNLPQTGTIAALVFEYYRSPEFIGLRASTKRTYRSVIEPLRKAHGEKRVTKLQRRHIKREMGKLADRPGAANKFLRYVRQLLNFAMNELEWIETNPALGIRKMKIPGSGFAEWPEAEIEKFQNHWPVGTKPRLAFDLLLYTGQRRSDIVAMSKNHVRGSEIRVVQQKTGKPLWIPIHPKLQISIAETPSKGMHFLETEYGKPFTANGFGNWFRKHCNRASIPVGYSAHGLRKASGRRLADAGCTAHQIMAVLGHTSLKEAERYTRGADQRKNARAAIRRVK